EIDRVERDERRQQGRRTCRSAVAGDEVTDGDEMRADAPGEGRRDAAMLEVELRVADLRLGIVDGGLRGPQVGRALVDVLGRPEVAALQFLSAIELALSEREPGRSRLELGLGLGQPDLIGAGVDGEEEITLVDDVAVLEMDADQRAADLGAELDLLDRGKL